VLLFDWGLTSILDGGDYADEKCVFSVAVLSERDLGLSPSSSYDLWATKKKVPIVVLIPVGLGLISLPSLNPSKTSAKKNRLKSNGSVV
jgi:hypothetical protein